MQYWGMTLSQFVSNSGTGNALAFYLVGKTMSCYETSFKPNKQNKQFWSESTNSFMHQSSILVASSSMMENLPSSCGWGWDVSLSLRRNLRVQPVQFCDGFLELWNSLDCTMGSCGEFSLLNTVQWHSALVSLFFFCDLGVELYSQDLVKFLRRRLFQDIFFKLAGSGLALASGPEDVRSFTVLLSGSKDYTYVYSQRQS